MTKVTKAYSTKTTIAVCLFYKEYTNGKGKGKNQEGRVCRR